MSDFLDQIDPILLRSINIQEINIKFDTEFLESEKQLLIEKKKYGLSADEKLGLVIIGNIASPYKASYVTALTSKRLLVYCQQTKIYDFAWTIIQDVSQCEEMIVLYFKDGASCSIRYGIFADDDDVPAGDSSPIADFIVSLIKEKIVFHEQTDNQ